MKRTIKINENDFVNLVESTVRRIIREEDMSQYVSPEMKASYEYTHNKPYFPYLKGIPSKGTHYPIYDEYGNKRHVDINTKQGQMDHDFASMSYNGHPWRIPSVPEIDDEMDRFTDIGYIPDNRTNYYDEYRMNPIYGKNTDGTRPDFWGKGGAAFDDYGYPITYDKDH